MVMVLSGTNVHVHVGEGSVLLQEKSSVSRSHAQGLYSLLHYCQCRLHELGGMWR